MKFHKSERFAQLFTTLVHLIGFVKAIKVGQRIAEVQTNLGDGALVIESGEDFRSCRVVLAGFDVIVEAMKDVADIRADLRKVKIVSMITKPLFGYRAGGQSLLIFAGVQQGEDIALAGTGSVLRVGFPIEMLDS